MFDFYLVGGVVRDELLGIKSKDIDYAVVPKTTGEAAVISKDINDIFAILATYLVQEGFEIFLQTPAMYTIRARFPKGHVNEGIIGDFVLARKELGYKPGTREPIVVPGTLLDDLTRRDFTCNAIAKDVEGKYIDPFNGITAIEHRILKTPIHGDITFADDPLRLIRAVRFAVTKDFLIHDSISDILLNFDYKNKFGVVSEERIYEELRKCFAVDTLKTIWLLTELYPSLGEYIFLNTNIKLTPVLIKK